MQRARRTRPLDDPDMMEVGNGMSIAEYRAFTMWCMLAAPLIAGNDVRKMNPGTAGTTKKPLKALIGGHDVLMLKLTP